MRTTADTNEMASWRRLGDTNDTNGTRNGTKLKVPLTVVSHHFLAAIRLNGSVFNLQLDLLHSITWISCADLGEETRQMIHCAPSCPKDAAQLQYDDAASQSASTPVDLCVTPTRVHVQIGDIDVRDFEVAVAQGANAMPHTKQSILVDGADGVLGLKVSFSPLDQGPAFGFSLFLSDNESTERSFLLFGGVDEQLIARRNLTAHLLPFTNKPASAFSNEANSTVVTPWDSAMWLMRVHWDDTSFSFSCWSSDTPQHTCDVVLDLNSGFITMPPWLFTRFLHKYLSKCATSTSTVTKSVGDRGGDIIYVCPRETYLPTLGFGIAISSHTWTNFELLPQEYTKPFANNASNSAFVRVLVRPSSRSDGSWQLGGVFLQRYYSFYNDSTGGVTLFCGPKDCTSGAFHDSSIGPASMSLWLASTILWSLVSLIALSFVTMRWCFGRRRRRFRSGSDESTTSDSSDNGYNSAP